MILLCLVNVSAKLEQHSNGWLRKKNTSKLELCKWNQTAFRRIEIDNYFHYIELYLSFQQDRAIHPSTCSPCTWTCLIAKGIISVTCFANWGWLNESQNLYQPQVACQHKCVRIKANHILDNLWNLTYLTKILLIWTKAHKRASLWILSRRCYCNFFNLQCRIWNTQYWHASSNKQCAHFHCRKEKQLTYPVFVNLVNIILIFYSYHELFTINKENPLQLSESKNLAVCVLRVGVLPALNFDFLLGLGLSLELAPLWSTSDFRFRDGWRKQKGE